jgi:serine/threonine protein kinase
VISGGTGFQVLPSRPTFVLQAISQLRGPVDALYALHYFRQDDSASFRHGDLKPENILVFLDDSALGTLKMSDMCLARFHSNVTEIRNFATGTRFGTFRYEPQEVGLSSKSPRSRRYDIWSFGCIALELLVWLLYGQDGLDKLSVSLRSTSGEPSLFFEVEEDVDTKPTARIHRSVVALMSYIQDFDPELSQESAARDLLGLIKN